MDFKVIGVWSNGDVEEQYCATQTDVENCAVWMMRIGKPEQTASVSITIINLTAKVSL